MEIQILLCILVTALLFSLDLYSRIPELCVTLNGATSAYLFKFFSKRTEFFTGIALFFIFSLGLIKFKCLDIGFEFRDLLQFLSYLRHGFRVNYKNCDAIAVLKSDCGLVREENEELYPEDTLFDVMSLRELVKAERQKSDLATVELDKERAAAATAAEEAMSMILKLQREKSSLEIESNSCRRLAEQKQQYDQQVIEFLRRVLMDQEKEKELLEDELRFCRGEMKDCRHCQSSNEFEEHEEDGSISSMEDELISSLEFDSWVL